MSQDIDQLIASHFQIHIVDVLPGVYNVFLQPAGEDGGQLVENLRDRDVTIVSEDGTSFPLEYDDRYQSFAAYAAQGVTKEQILNGHVEVADEV